MKQILTASLITAVLALPLSAMASPKVTATHGDWTVYTNGAGADRICYVMTKPTSKSPGNVNHGDVFFLVSSWQSGAATEQPSFLAGYPLKTTRAPKAAVGSTTVTMFGADNEAFIQSGADERKLVQKMRAGATMNITATSARGTQTRYQFSLKGVSAALKKAKAACG